MTQTPDIGTPDRQPQRDNPSPSGGQTAPAAEGDSAPTEQQPGAGGSGSAATGTPEDTSPASGGQSDPSSISDEQLPEDLRPTDDNPLAKPLSGDDEDRGISLGPDGPQA